MEVVKGYGIPIATKDQNYWMDNTIVSFRYDDDPEEFAKKVAEVKGLNTTDY